MVVQLLFEAARSPWMSMYCKTLAVMIATCHQKFSQEAVERHLPFWDQRRVVDECNSASLQDEDKGKIMLMLFLSFNY